MSAALRAAAVALTMAAGAPAANAQSSPPEASPPDTAPADATQSPSRAPAAPVTVPDPEVVEVIVGVWQAEISDGSGGTSEWRLDLQPDGVFAMQVTEHGETRTRVGSYQVDAMSMRLIYPGAADEADPNSTALNLSDARSLETYFYRLLGPDRMAFRPTLCSFDPCQWIADREE
jgi:hypothetical protein